MDCRETGKRAQGETAAALETTAARPSATAQRLAGNGQDSVERKR